MNLVEEEGMNMLVVSNAWMVAWDGQKKFKTEMSSKKFHFSITKEATTSLFNKQLNIG